MFDLDCPACHARYPVDDKFRGRKIRCPRCGTRVRHLPDGQFEILSMGEVPPPAPPPAAPAPGAAADPTRPVPEPADVPLLSAAVAGSESSQNRIVALALIHILAVGILVVGIALGAAALSAGISGVILGLTWGVVMYLRRRGVPREQG